MEFSSFQIGVWSFEAKVWSLWFIEVIKSELVLFQAVSFTVLTHNTCYNLIIIKSSLQIFVTSNAFRYHAGFVLFELLVGPKVKITIIYSE